MPKFRDLTGMKIGKLTVISYDKNYRWNCKCECGNEKSILARSLVHAQTKSCGCLFVEVHTKHGLSHNRFYDTWKHMIGRCYLSSDRAYKNYGGRGITVCDEWRSNPEGMKVFIYWAEKQNPPNGYELDRRDNNLGYYPNNCWFVSVKKQNNNKRSNRQVIYEGKTYSSITQFVEQCGVVNIITVFSRIQIGWDPIRAALTPKLYTRK